MLEFFAEKMWVAFAVQKLFTFFQQNISEYCILNPLKQLTKWPLMSSLSWRCLNNWALKFCAILSRSTWVKSRSWTWKKIMLKFLVKVFRDKVSSGKLCCLVTAVIYFYMKTWFSLEVPHQDKCEKRLSGAMEFSTNLGPVIQNLTTLLANVMLKFLSWNMANTLIFFAEKMWVAFASQKLLTFLQQKYQCIYINKLIKLTILWTRPWINAVFLLK